MSTTITVFSGVDTPSPGFSTTTVSPAKEELGPGWAMDDVYPPLAELRRALLTDEEWAAMSSWEKDVWEMYYRPDWERLACIEQILVDTPAAQREQRHEEILEALRNLAASATKPASAAAANSCIVNLDTSHAVPVDTAPTTIEEGPEVAFAASTCFITTVPVNCSTDCSAQQPLAAPVLVASLPPTLTEYNLNTNGICDAPVHQALVGVCRVVLAPGIQMQQLYGFSELVRPSSSQCVTNKVPLHRPMPWPSLLDIHPIGDDTRPLPWQSFMEEYDCEAPSVTLLKQSQCCSSEDFRAESCATLEFQILEFYGNLFTSTGYIIVREMCSFSELRCLDEMLLCLKYWWSSGNYVQSIDTTLVWHLWFIPGFPLWPSFMGVHVDRVEARPLPWPSFGKSDGCEFPGDAVEKESRRCISDGSPATLCDDIKFSLTDLKATVIRLELKLVPIGSVFITFLTVLVDSSNVPALTCAYFGVDSTVCIGSWLIAGWHQELYCSSFSCDTVCESILAPTIFSFVGANLICFSSAEVCALLVGLLRSGARIKSEMSKDAGTHATNVIIAVEISHSSMVRSRFGTGHAGLFQGFILMCWLQEQLLATWPPPIASCSVPKNMFLNAELSTLVICEFCGYMFRNVRSLELKCPKPEAFVNCATHDASYWPGNFVPVVQMQVPEQDIYLNMLDDWLLQNQIILTRTSTACITEWIVTPWDSGQEVVLFDFTKVSCSQAVHDTYLKKPMFQNLNVSESNGSVSMGVLVCWSTGAGYLAWISDQEKKISYVVVVKEYYEPKFQCELQQKEFTEIELATWSDLRVLIQFSWCALNPWSPLRLMVCSYRILLEHVSMGVELTHAEIILCLQNMRVNITKYIITTWFRYRILVRLAIATHLAVRSNCLTDMGTKTTWYSDSKYSMMVMNNCAKSVHVKILHVAYATAQMEWDNIPSVLSRGLIHLGSQDFKFARSVMGRLSLFILIQSVALKNMEPSWSTTALLTEIASMFSTGFSVQPYVDCSVQSILLFTHTYQLRIVAPIMFSSAWDNLDCISHSRTARCTFQVTSSELLFIGAFGGGQEPIQGGRHMTGLDLYMVLRFPWDPGVAAAAWGQAAFQGGRGVRDPLHTMGRRCGPWPSHHHKRLWGCTGYKYTHRSNGDTIRLDHGEPGSHSLSLLLLPRSPSLNSN